MQKFAFIDHKRLDLCSHYNLNNGKCFDFTVYLSLCEQVSWMFNPSLFPEATHKHFNKCMCLSKCYQNQISKRSIFQFTHKFFKGHWKHKLLLLTYLFPDLLFLPREQGV